MSYDMMVFDPAAAPTEAEAFLAWYHTQTDWNEAHDHDDPKVTTPALQAFFADLAEHFPPMNGPLADQDDDRAEVTDYSIAQHVIYGSFADSVAERAHGIFQVLANTHGVGFFDASSDEAAIVYPDGKVLVLD